MIRSLIYCLPACLLAWALCLWFLLCGADRHRAMMPRCRWGFSNLFVLLWRELLRITSAALETTPAPEWEQRVLSNHQTIICMQNTFRTILSVCSNIQTAAREALKHEDVHFAPQLVSCQVWRGGRWSLCTPWQERWRWTAFATVIPLWSIPSSTAWGSLFARAWRPGWRGEEAG